MNNTKQKSIKDFIANRLEAVMGGVVTEREVEGVYEILENQFESKIRRIERLEAINTRLIQSLKMKQAKISIDNCLYMLKEDIEKIILTGQYSEQGFRKSVEASLNRYRNRVKSL